MPPFLSIVTRRHGGRPGLYARHEASLAEQTCQDIEHVTFHGGSTLYEANRSLYRNREQVNGRYVLVLDDDDRLIDAGAVEAIRQAAKGRPAVIMLRMLIDGRTYPTESSWESIPRRGHIGASCFAVRRDVWLRHIRYWAQPRAGDYFFIRSIISGCTCAGGVVWLDRVCSETMRVSNGAPEAPAKNGPANGHHVSAETSWPRLVTFVPYAPDGNLGGAYNDAMERVREDEWAVFLDHDAMWLTRDWYAQLARAASAHPRAGLLTARTNRVANLSQVVGDVRGHDVRRHRQLAMTLVHDDGSIDVTRRRPGISGVVIATPKRVWDEVKRMNGHGFEDGFLGVDNAYHRAVAETGFEVRILQGLYVYHWYRGDGDTSHLKNGRRVPASV